MVAASFEAILTTLAALDLASLYCDKIDFPPRNRCGVYARYYQPSGSQLDVYDVSDFASLSMKKPMLTFEVSHDLSSYFPDYGYYPSTNMLHTFNSNNGGKTDIFTYKSITTEPKSYNFSFPKINNGFCFGELNQYYCISEFATNSFVLYHQPSLKKYNKTMIIEVPDQELKFYQYDYCSSSVLFVSSDEKLYVVNLYNWVSGSPDIQTSKLNYRPTLCQHGSGKLHTTPSFLTAVVGNNDTIEENYANGMIEFGICQKKDATPKKDDCPTLGTHSIIWISVCGTGLVADIIMVIVVLIYWRTTRKHDNHSSDDEEEGDIDVNVKSDSKETNTNEKKASPLKKKPSNVNKKKGTPKRTLLPATPITTPPRPAVVNASAEPTSKDNTKASTLLQSFTS